MDTGPRIRRRRLGKRAVEVAGGCGRIAQRVRASRGVAQDRDHPFLAGWGREHELGGNLLGRSPAIVQEPRGARMADAARPGGQVAVDRGEDDRVHEGERAVAHEDVGAAQRLHRVPGCVRVEPGERRGHVRRRALAEQRQGPRHLGGRGREARKPPSTTVEIASGPSPRTFSASASVARRRLSSTSRSSSETRNGLPAVVSWQAPQKASAASRSTASRTQRLTAGRESGAGRSTVVEGSVTRPRRASARGRVPTTSAIGSSSSRRWRNPRKLRLGSSAHCASSTARSSDLLGGEVRAEPVQAVQSRVGGARRAGVRSLAAEHRAGEAGSARQPALAVVWRRGEEHGLEQLAHDAERERALQLRPASGERAHALLARQRASGAEEPRLADAAGSRDDEHPARTLARALDRRGDGGKLALAFEELVHHAAILNRCGSPHERVGVRRAEPRRSGARGAGSTG